MTRLGTLKPTVFALIDFTAGYHQTELDEHSRHLTAFMAMGGLYQWTRVAMGLKGAGPYFQRSMSNTVLAGLVYQICELYIDDVLIHDRDIESFLANSTEGVLATERIQRHSEPSQDKARPRGG